MKSQYTKTYCEYQVYGEDNLENQFLKKVFHFCIDYVQNNVDIFSTIHNNVQHIINFCRPSFEKISSNPTTVQLKNIKRNPFFNEYEEAIKIGSYILRQFDYNISATNGKEIKTPPFWIDMPKLFELYVYKELLRANFSHRFDDISYQFATYGNRLDFLIKDDQIPMIVDTKYKLHYQNSQIHNDIRQVSGYSRLNKVREKLEIKDDRNIDCLIIYPVLDKEFNDTDLSLNNIKQERQEIKSYYKIYKLGVHLPTI